MAKPKNKPFVGKNTKMRVYFTAQKEIFELHCDFEDKLLLYNDGFKHVSVGESIESFVYGDFEDIYKSLEQTEKYFININENVMVNECWDSILQLTDEMILRHPYFYIVKQIVLGIYVREQQRLKEKKYIDIYTLSSLVSVYESMKEDFYTLISDCLNSEINKQYSSLFKYIELVNENKFLNKSKLTYGKVISEMDLVEDIFVVQDEKAPNGFTNIPSVYRASKGTKGNRPIEIFDMLYPNTLIDLYNYLIANYLRSKVKFKICKNCERYFAVIGNSKAEYCNKLMLGSDKSCRQMGAMRIYESKKHENPINKEYTKAYKTRNARIRYGTMSREEFEKWSVEARNIRDKCLAGFTSFEEFESWLKKN